MSDEETATPLENREMFLQLIEYRINWLKDEQRYLERIRSDIKNGNADFDEHPEVYLTALGLEKGGKER